MYKRAIDILKFKPVDRLPAVHFGYWYELLVEWAEQGKIPRDLVDCNWDNTQKEKELDKILGWDHNWCCNYGGKMGLNPVFESKVLEELPNGFVRMQNADGLIERVKVGVQGIPAEDDYQLKDRKAWEELYKPKMQFSPDRVDLEFFKNFRKENYDHPVGLEMGSVIGSIRNMLSVIGLSYTLCDDFELMEEIVDTYAEMQYQVIKTILESGATFDFAHYWEDMCFNNGPLINPMDFEDLCAKHYKKRNDLVKSYGIDIISLDCDGVTDRLLPIWFNNGVNTMFPIEIGTWGDQFGPAREKFGKGLLGVGGFDKTVLRIDKEAVDKEIERLKPLIAMGGFVPCPDHRLMPGTKFELVQYYIDKIKNIKI